ncbi:MAG: outer membrane lipoprotein-sorting protein [Bacteroidales bacterium]|nr:outer membrane lipoprotein-sorting protein [Bacteroidales bacterium]
MKKLVFIIIITIIQAAVYSQNATEIIRKADEKYQGEKSSKSEITVQIVRPTWERTIACKNWSKGKDYALTLITAPAKEKDQSFLKIKNELWSWNPVISRLIKLPPSMLSQGWMNSDYTNDDILKETSIVKDYTHKIIAEETIENYVCYKIELIPKKDAAVVWGKIIKWIDKKEYIQMKSEYYDEENLLVKTDFSYDIKLMDNRLLPSRMEIIPANKKGNKTVVKMLSVKFNLDIPDSFFSQQNMKRVMSSE